MRRFRLWRREGKCREVDVGYASIASFVDCSFHVLFDIGSEDFVF
jgi:hypothetical protein